VRLYGHRCDSRVIGATVVSRDHPQGTPGDLGCCWKFLLIHKRACSGRSQGVLFGGFSVDIPSGRGWRCFGDPDILLCCECIMLLFPVFTFTNVEGFRSRTVPPQKDLPWAY